MGMPYIPVYEGDDTEDGSVKLSPGKLQRTGVKLNLPRRASSTPLSVHRYHPAR